MKLSVQNLGLSKHGREVLEYLIRTKDDYELFISDFWTGRTTELQAISRFRLHKLEQNKMSLDEFISEYNENKIEALERLFQHKVIQWDTDKLEENMKRFNFTLENLYRVHLLDRKKSLLTWLSVANINHFLKHITIKQ